MKHQALFTEICNALQGNDYAALDNIIAESPSNASAEIARGFLQSNDPFYAMVSMNTLAMNYLFGNNYDYAEVFARACFDRAYQFHNWGGLPGHDDLNYYTGSSFYYLLKILLDTGRYNEGIELYESVIRQYPELVKDVNFISAHLEASEIYLTNNDIEKARKIIASQDVTQIPPASLILYDRLRSKIDKLTSGATDLPEDVTRQKNKLDSESIANMVKSLDYLLQNPPDSSERTNQLNKQIQRWKNSIANNVIADDFEQATKIFEEIYTYFKSVSSNEEENYLTGTRYRTQQIQKIFFDDVNGFSVPHLEAAVSSFKNLMNELELSNNQSDVDDLLWSLYICYKRMEQYEIAAETLEKLNARLELTRNSLSNINERAGVFNKYVHFFAALSEMYYLSGQPHGLFKIIESSKGRNLADKVLSEMGKELSKLGTENLFTQLTDSLGRNAAHYLSIFTDEEWSYSVLVTSAGKIIACCVPIGQTHLEQWVQKDYPDPLSWKAPKAGFFSKKVDLSVMLTDFLKPIEIALKDELISTGDHIVYSPDGYMHLFPLHYIKQTNGRYFIEDYSLSKVHSAAQLIQLLEKEPAQPKEFLTITTSAIQDEDNGDKINNFGAVRDWLQQNKNCITVPPTVSDVLQLMNSHQLIHFATHGSFPKKNYEDPKQNNPFYSCGLLLCVDDVKPSLDAEFNYYKTDNLLNPQTLQEAGCNLSKSHVSIQACVSGRAKEGVGGDALGLEWAFFSSGVTSLVSANWDIDSNVSKTFFIKFYDYWLIHQMSKAKAFHRAVTEMMKTEAGEYFSVFVWGGLTLSGDFR